MTNKDKTKWRDPKDRLYPSRHPSAKDPADDLKQLEEELYGCAEELKHRVHRFMQELSQSDHPLKKQKLRALKRLLASFT